MTDQELRKEFEKIARVNGLVVKESISAPWEYRDSETMAAWVIFKKGYSLAQEIIKAKDAEIERLRENFIFQRDEFIKQSIELDGKERLTKELLTLLSEIKICLDSGVEINPTSLLHSQINLLIDKYVTLT